MSREIKFRIWYPNYKKMQTGIDIDFEHACMDIRNGKLIFNIDELDYDEVPEYFAESGYVLMQFTGLLDKNGKEVYEGDISYEDGEYMVVVFEDGRYGLKFTTSDAYFDTCISWDHVNIIGNIYENPELKDGAK